MEYLRPVKGVFTKPGLFFLQLKDSGVSHKIIFLKYALPLLVISSLGRIWKPTVLQEDMSLFSWMFCIHFFANALSLWLGPWMIARLAPSFQSKRDFALCLSMVVFAYIPFLLAQGLSAFFPESWLVGIPGLIYTVFLYGFALPRVLHTPPERVLGFTLISFFILLGISYGTNLILSGLFIFVE